jgi:hypothetical protein
MTPHHLNCREKTARGNHYADKASAKRASSRWQRITGAPMNAYRCKCCRGWHVGTKPPKVKP